MLHNVSEKIANYLARSDVIARDMIEVYQYGLELLISCIITNVSILVVASWMDSIMMGILYLVIFIPLRMTCGGYHASTYSLCYTISIIGYISVSIIAKILSLLPIPSIIWIISLFASVMYILKNAPVKNEKHPVSDKILKKNKYRATILSKIYCLSVSIAYICTEKKVVLNFVVLVVLSVATFMLPIKKKGE